MLKEKTQFKKWQTCHIPTCIPLIFCTHGRESEWVCAFRRMNMPYNINMRSKGKSGEFRFGEESLFDYFLKNFNFFVSLLLNQNEMTGAIATFKVSSYINLNWPNIAIFLKDKHLSHTSLCFFFVKFLRKKLLFLMIG